MIYLSVQFQLTSAGILHFLEQIAKSKKRIADPDPNPTPDPSEPYGFGPPGSGSGFGSISQRF